jgi:hypothetical protein
MSFSKRAVHTLEGNETAIRVTDCHAYVDGQIACLSQGTLDGPICFGKSNRHIDRLDGRVQYCALEFCSCCQFFIITRAGGDRCTAEFRLDLCQLRVKRVTSVRSRRLRNVRYASNTDRSDSSQRTAALCWECAGSRLAGAVSSARDQFQPGRRMEGAHQHVHPDHSIQR